LINPICAEVGIRQLHARYTDAIWRKDFEAFGELFTDDAEWRFAGMVARGRGEIVENFRRMAGGFSRVLVTLNAPILEVHSGTAIGRTYVTERAVLSDGKPFAPIGIYYERFVDEGGRWRFAWRFFQTYYAGPPDLSGAFFDNPDYGVPPHMPAHDELPADHTGLLRN
jgi:uncharacterized protein (TIGR02246 family)